MSCAVIQLADYFFCNVIVCYSRFELVLAPLTEHDFAVSSLTLISLI